LGLGRRRSLAANGGASEGGTGGECTEPEDPVPEPVASESESNLSEEQKRDNMIRLVFGGSQEQFQKFCETVRDAIPLGVGAVIRGSAVTGQRWRDGAIFDADGPGTSDLDLTLVGGDALRLFRLEGFYVPGLHSRPLSSDDDTIAPELLPLRAKLIALVNRPVNIQATGDLMMFLRGDLLGQPYLTIVARSEPADGPEPQTT
jgi:hypothetical protein